MSCFLLIHTSLDRGFAAIAEDDKIIVVKDSLSPKEHGSFLHEAIHQLADSLQGGLQQIDVLGVTNGPGSYTGIRVGLSAAKGLAYALRKPLILCSTLQVMAGTAVAVVQKPEMRYVPIIHARQDEYYCGVYDSRWDAVEDDALVDFQQQPALLRQSKSLVFWGDDPVGFEEKYGIKVASSEPVLSEKSMARIIFEKFSKSDLTNAEDARPLYLKSAYVTNRKKR